MGNMLVRALTKMLGKAETKIIMVGLDAAGKTTLLFKMKLGELVTTIPTIGMNVESVKYKNISFTSWDIGGRDKIRPLWRHYWQGTSALIYVVDSNDRYRYQEASDELSKLLREDELRDAALLVFANKQDLPNAMSVAEITDKLGLHSIRNRQWYIQASCMTTGDGIYEGLDWLSNTIAKDKASTGLAALAESSVKQVQEATKAGIQTLSQLSTYGYQSIVSGFSSNNDNSKDNNSNNNNNATEVTKPTDETKATVNAEVKEEVKEELKKDITPEIQEPKLVPEELPEVIEKKNTNNATAEE